MNTWKLLVKESLNDFLSDISNINYFADENIQLFTAMSLRGIILESAQIGRFSDDNIKRNFISFSLPLELVNSITSQLVKFNVIFLISSFNNHIDLSYRSKQLFHNSDE